MDGMPRHEGKRPKTSHMPMVSRWETDKYIKFTGIYTDIDGTMYFNNDDSQVQQRNAFFRKSIVTIAGSLGGNHGYVDGDPGGARFNCPCGIVKDLSGNIIVVDTNNNCLRKISCVGATVSTIAGSDEAGFADGQGIDARFNKPVGIVATGSGDFVVSDSGNNCLRLVTASGNVRTLCGSAEEGFQDGDGTEARFSWPTGMAIDKYGHVLVADTNNDAIRHVTVPWGIVTTFAGTGVAGFHDGLCLESQFYGPMDVAIDGNGVAIVADSKNHRIRKIEHGVVKTVVGINERGDRDGPASTAMFNHPHIVKIDNKGQLIVAETPNYGNLRIIDGGFAAPVWLKHETSTANATRTTNLAIQDYKKLMSDETFADFDVVVHGERFKVHKNVMACRSEHFKAAFAQLASSNEPKNECFITDQAVSAAAFRVVLNFWYTGDVPACPQETLDVAKYTGAFRDLEREVLVAADFFCEYGMLECCTHLFEQRLTVHTAVEQLVWALSLSVGLVNVTNDATQYFLKNAAAIQVGGACLSCT